MKQWFPAYGLEGRYEVTSDGDVRSVIANPRPMKPQKHYRGYHVLKLMVSPGVKKTRTVHSLIAETFLGERPKGAQVNHIDCNKTNNQSDNLEWATSKENVAHAKSNGLMQGRLIGTAHGGNPQTGSSNFNSRLTEDDVLCIRYRLSRREKMSSICEDYDISLSLLSQIRSRKKWGHI